mmetsp:Transcript_34893/g.64592  ORF Transcript_34893/g.64592 Transcript_34893/m.64592 type:complete len:212 (-) Transcript_34893:204-839(-)
MHAAGPARQQTRACVCGARPCCQCHPRAPCRCSVRWHQQGIGLSACAWSSISRVACGCFCTHRHQHRRDHGAGGCGRGRRRRAAGVAAVAGIAEIAAAAAAAVVCVPVRARALGVTVARQRHSPCGQQDPGRMCREPPGEEAAALVFRAFVDRRQALFETRSLYSSSNFEIVVHRRNPLPHLSLSARELPCTTGLRCGTLTSKCLHAAELF